jgi:hypothetical protein
MSLKDAVHTLQPGVIYFQKVKNTSRYVREYNLISAQNYDFCGADFHDVDACSTILAKNSHTDFHENATDGLLAGIRSRPNARGLHKPFTL